VSHHGTADVLFADLTSDPSDPGGLSAQECRQCWSNLNSVTDADRVGIVNFKRTVYLRSWEQAGVLRFRA